MTPEERAHALVAKHGITRAPVNVESIAIAEGIQVARSGVTNAAVVGFLLHEDGRTIIGINSRRSPRRQRLIIAHSLGHWVLHRGRHLTIDHDMRLANADAVPTCATRAEDADANRFAGALLMPEPLLAPAVAHEVATGLDVQDRLILRLAADFEVSTEAMGWRLTSLGWLT